MRSSVALQSGKILPTFLINLLPYSECTSAVDSGKILTRKTSTRRHDVTAYVIIYSLVKCSDVSEESAA